jgi:hypothetical protein
VSDASSKTVAPPVINKVNTRASWSSLFFRIELTPGRRTSDQHFLSAWHISHTVPLQHSHPKPSASSWEMVWVAHESATGATGDEKEHTAPPLKREAVRPRYHSRQDKRRNLVPRITPEMRLLGSPLGKMLRQTYSSKCNSY